MRTGVVCITFEYYNHVDHSLLEEPDVDDSYDNIKLLIELDRSILHSTDNEGDLPIHVACENPHITLKVIQLLLNGQS